jgi:hydroxymethylglutaryl-CoA reductase
MPKENSSAISGFYKLSLDQRREKLADLTQLDQSEIETLASGGLSASAADPMIENVVGTFALPLGIALNFQVNQRDVLVPMVIEEPSVVAGASFMAKLARPLGGFTASTTAPEMIGQIQLLDIEDLSQAEAAILDAHSTLITSLADTDPILKKLGGGPRDIEVRRIEDSPIGPFLVVHIVYDVRDAMGANAVNTACETLAPQLESLTGGRAHLRILSNLADRRLATASCKIAPDSLAFQKYSGEEVRDGIIEAWAFAAADPYRAATHNKGIMNGVDAVVMATGNDWRAIEAGAHAYAARQGSYTSLSHWSQDKEGNLVGQLEMPMAIGTVGGATRVHPSAQLALKILGVQGASELAQIIASVGLAQNLAALRALATEGIQRGHMSLHARQVAVAAGAAGSQIERLAQALVSEETVRIDRAQELLNEWSQQ